MLQSDNLISWSHQARTQTMNSWNFQTNNSGRNRRKQQRELWEELLTRLQVDKRSLILLLSPSLSHSSSNRYNSNVNSRLFSLFSSLVFVQMCFYLSFHHVSHPLSLIAYHTHFLSCQLSRLVCYLWWSNAPLPLRAGTCFVLLCKSGQNRALLGFQHMPSMRSWVSRACLAVTVSALVCANMQLYATPPKKR